jgi:hypothetical protein
MSVAMRQVEERMRTSFVASESRSVGVLVRFNGGGLRAVLFVMRGQSTWVEPARLEGGNPYQSHIYAQSRCL